MITYFKYTTGESFTLNGKDYTGFFNVVENSAYTGKVRTDTSETLVPKNTMLVNCYLGKKEFDRTTTPVDISNVVNKPEISPRNVIDQTFLNKNLGILNNNNLNLYALNLIPDINLTKFKTAHADSNSYFLGVSAGETDLKNNDTKLAKNNERPLQIVPFSHTDKLGTGINNLDDTVDSSLIVNGDQSFKYITTTSTGAQTLCGTFAANGSLKVIKEDEFPANSTLQYDQNTKTLYNIRREPVLLEEEDLTPAQAAIRAELHNKQKQLEIRTLLGTAVGSISSRNRTPDEASRIASLIGCQGFHAHTEVWDKTQGNFFWPDDREEVTYYMPCESMESYQRLINPSIIALENGQIAADLEELYTGIGQYIIYAYDASSYITTGSLQLKDQITITDAIIDSTIKIGTDLKGYIKGGAELNKIILTEKWSKKASGIIGPTNPKKEKIISFDIRDTDDSVLVITSETDNNREYNLYHIDTENKNIISLNPSNTAFKGTITRYGTSTTNDPVARIKFSSRDSNIYVLSEGGFVASGFISNPDQPASAGLQSGLLYPTENKWGEYNETVDLSQLKWNTNKLASNYFTNLQYHHSEFESEIYTLLHNIGRIYLSSSKDILYNNFIPLDLVNNYKAITGAESSLGLSVNSELQEIIKDALNIFYNISTVSVPKEVEGIPLLAGYTSPKEININFRDLEFHENEEVNYNTVWRVFSKIYEFQKSIIQKVIQPPTDELTAVNSMLVNYTDSNGDLVQVEHADNGRARVRRRVRRSPRAQTAAAETGAYVAAEDCCPGTVKYNNWLAGKGQPLAGKNAKGKWVAVQKVGDWYWDGAGAIGSKQRARSRDNIFESNLLKIRNEAGVVDKDKTYWPKLINAVVKGPDGKCYVLDLPKPGDTNPTAATWKSNWWSGTVDAGKGKLLTIPPGDKRVTSDDTKRRLWRKCKCCDKPSESEKETVPTPVGKKPPETPPVQGKIPADAAENEKKTEPSPVSQIPGKVETSPKDECCTPVVSFWACLFPDGTRVNVLNSWLAAAAVSIQSGKNKGFQKKFEANNLERADLNRAIADTKWDGVVVRVWEAMKQRQAGGRYIVTSKCYKIKEGMGNQIFDPTQPVGQQYPRNQFAQHPHYLTKEFLDRVNGNTADAVWEECTCCPEPTLAPYNPLREKKGKITTFGLAKAFNQPILTKKRDNNGKLFFYPCPELSPKDMTQSNLDNIEKDHPGVVLTPLR